MVAYRFCRPDDVPLLVRAVNECWAPHGRTGAAPPLTEEGFRRWMKELDVWPSNSMVALDGTGSPVAVSIATKRPAAVRIHRVAVRPGHQRQGHGRHLLTSLSQKLAVLGPERLLAELPAAWQDACGFFSALGWSAEEELIDRELPAPAAEAVQPVPDALMVPVTVAELAAAGLLAASPHAAWERDMETLRQRDGELMGIAVANPDGIEACLVSEPFAVAQAGGPAIHDGGRRPPLDVLAFACRDPARADFLLGLLFRWLSHAARRPLRIPRLSAAERPGDALVVAGFQPAARHLRYAARAKAL